ncbi:hypothetical protein M6B38_106670 [Iris pallida]|uniref:Uncharacterized protein n=1 Tax=Iris pallida TaxID=29817 RepID=A0AAX6ESK4_IRIPA|nr:hypothetical protein M6B38_106670 [Iris pallida]
MKSRLLGPPPPRLVAFSAGCLAKPDVCRPLSYTYLYMTYVHICLTEWIISRK